MTPSDRMPSGAGGGLRRLGFAPPVSHTRQGCSGRSGRLAARSGMAATTRARPQHLDRKDTA